MSQSALVLVVTHEPQTARSVADVINSSDQLSASGVCQNLDDLHISLDRTHAPAVVVDIDPNPSQMLNDLESVINRNPGTRFIVLASAQESELMLQAMQAGVRHFMRKEAVKTELLSVLQRLMPSNVSRNGWHGSIVTILSAGGGCGATTLAINLAYELHLLAKQPSLLVDLDGSYGAAAGYLGVTAQYGIADVLADGDRIDTQLVRSTAVAHSEELHLLASPATVDIDDPKVPAYQHLSRALQKCRDVYGYTVVDAPRVPMNVAALLANASLMTYIVFEMNVEHIRVARAMYAGLTGRNVPQERVLPLVNRFRGRREMITLEEAQRAIGCGRIGHLSNDYKGVLSSINFGKPLGASSPRSALRTDIQNLAKTLRSVSATPKQALVTN